MPSPCLACKPQNCDTCTIKPKRKCGRETEVFSRVCGYHRPVKNWNKGKVQEFSERKPFKLP
jgi:anaerobic ribonucleoside-triphosphate reductase